ncbi:MAG: hypothetical protein DKM50_02140 [Candidatus Margulisiibacteriota bacterium]|nr:MAG: hypothetical protein A2X43_06600 [Candidatus Margulisbacteria bacterium GWD2_39_127]OGI05311.1 MAG: hypothetical protein A2X42_03885 [Candidatus Margulisbacteria bacterium GWF2_38_17]OGI10830.1 MAG: hypothetical protein A2X41_05590 [Candidatus Margulisbacteria bacterium GWE2_39_32]PZM83516.1 MAG: hypothetical protein DKM50_02140 [Candidatus Margulisiibacteriota bacterium]HAR64307.1 hypothetical protein [Candidatus Margulisiibacteriota bacterium]
MKKYLSILISLLISILLLLSLSSCSNVQSQVTPRLQGFDQIPAQVDLLADDGKFVKTELPAVNIKAEVNTPSNPLSIIRTENLPGITITSYKVKLSYQNTTLSSTPIPEYSTKTTVYIKPNETVKFSFPFFNDQQWKLILNTYAVNNLSDQSVYSWFIGVNASITFYGHDDAGNDFEIPGSFTASFGNIY